ncbi:MAG: response regulator transcription factor [Caldilineaceae bacterium]|nr:response regulator transcription factor [Caldilineaceae bacterium]
MVRVLVVEVYDVLRQSLLDLLGELPGVAVMGGVPNSAYACVRIHREQIDVVILSTCQLSARNLGSIQAMRQANPKAAVIVVGGETAPGYAQLAFRSGARGYVTRAHIVEELGLAIQTVARGEMYLARACSDGDFRGSDVISRSSHLPKDPPLS